MSRSGNYIKQLEGYKAFIPKPLPPEPNVKLSDELCKKLSQADLLIAKLDGMAYGLLNVDLFIAMYVKKEALLSSQIEGSQASLENIFEFESDNQIENTNIDDIQEVINYIKALNFGIERLKKFPMSLRFIRELHEILMRNTRGQHKTPGEFKRSQNWIGAANSNLNTAAFVPPPVKESMDALADLEKYMYTDSNLPELINCALIHYQFETIHPFLDGNGRIGRLMIILYLYWKNIIEKPLLYISYFFKKNKQEYFDRLTLVRNKGDYEQWISFFLDAVIETSQSAIDNTRKILDLQKKHQDLLWEKKVSSPMATAALNQLFYTPIVSINALQKKLEISYPTASHLIQQFVELEILKEVTGQKRAKRYIYKKYMDILSQGTH